MNRNVTVLGVLYLLLGALGLVAALLVFFGPTRDPATGAGGITSVTAQLGVVLAWVLLVISLPTLLVGGGLLAKKHWARPLALLIGGVLLLFGLLSLLLGVVGIFFLPIAAGLGFYTFWVLMKEDVARSFAP